MHEHIQTRGLGLLIKLGVGVTRHAEILEIEGLFTQGSRPGRMFSERSVEFSKWTVLICRAGFVAISSIPDPTLSLRIGRVLAPPATTSPTCAGRANKARGWVLASSNQGLTLVHF